MKKVQAVVSVKFFKNVKGHKLGYQDLMCNAFEGHHQVISLLLDFYHAIMFLSFWKDFIIHMPYVYGQLICEVIAMI